MKNLVPIVILLLLHACQRETFNVQPSTVPEFTSVEQTLQFLAQQHPEVYTAAEVNRVKALLAEPVQTRGNGVTVEVEAPSEDALQAAIDEAGAGGTVVLKAGEHRINSMVTISHEIHLTGEAGATLIIANPALINITDAVNPGIYINGGSKTSITSLELRASDDLAGVAVMVHDADHVLISRNRMINFQVSIVNYYGDNLRIIRNEIISAAGWQTGAIPDAYGIVNINGRNVIISTNKVSNALFGIWPCDRGGVTMGNETFGCYLGQILCKVAPVWQLFDGTIMGSDQPANHWLQINNYSHDNFFVGYLAIDGAHDNFIVGNKSANNGMYDMELTGDTERFGFLTPKAYNNTVYLTPDIIVKDCGENNRVVGGKKVDTSVDACF